MESQNVRLTVPAAEESWAPEERETVSSHIEEGYLQAERGELIDGAQVQREIQAMKETWLQQRGLGRWGPAIA